MSSLPAIDEAALLDIAWAAHELEDGLGRNCMNHADWPADIVVDNTKDADRLTELLKNLQEQLKPYRKKLGLPLNAKEKE